MRRTFDAYRHDYRFCKNQKREIKSGFEAGLSAKSIALYAIPQLNYKQMQSLRIAIMRGAPVDTIKQMAADRTPWGSIQAYNTTYFPDKRSKIVEQQS